MFEKKRYKKIYFVSILLIQIKNKKDIQKRDDNVVKNRLSTKLRRARNYICS